MKKIDTPLKDCFVFEPVIHGDPRGFFLESFNQKVFNELTNTNYSFVQDNHSLSIFGVLRGLHYQYNRPQGKLVRVLVGKVYDVVVDMRKSSTTFGKWYGVHLSADNKRLLWVPPGFAHGFVTLSKQAEFFYKTTEYYTPADEKILIWNDPDLAIDWKLGEQPTLSAKDLNGSSFKYLDYYD